MSTTEQTKIPTTTSSEFVPPTRRNIVYWSAVVSVLVLLSLLVEFLVRDGQALVFACNPVSPSASVPSSWEQLDFYFSWLRSVSTDNVLVVDVGCGTGSVVDAVDRALGNTATFDVIGFDRDPVCIEQARGLYPERRFWVADMSHFTPPTTAPGCHVCYILYEPLWQCAPLEAKKVYEQFFVSVVSQQASDVSVLYVSGSGAFLPKTHLLGWRDLESIGFLYEPGYSRTIGSVFLRRSCHLYHLKKTLL